MTAADPDDHDAAHGLGTVLKATAVAIGVLALVGVGIYVTGGFSGATPVEVDGTYDYPGERQLAQEHFSRVFLEELEQGPDGRVVDVQHISTRGNTVYADVTGPGDGFTEKKGVVDAFALALNQSWSNGTHTWGIDHAVVRYNPGGGSQLGATTTWRIEEWWMHEWIIDGAPAGRVIQRIGTTGADDALFNDTQFQKEIKNIQNASHNTFERFGKGVFISLTTNLSNRHGVSTALMKIEKAANRAKKEGVDTFSIFVSIEDNNDGNVRYYWMTTAYSDIVSRDGPSAYRNAISRMNYSGTNIPGPELEFSTLPFPGG